MFEINSNKTIKKVNSLPLTGDERFLYYNTTDGILYSWNTVTNQFEKLNNSGVTGDRYKTTSTTCNNIVSTGNLTFTVETGLAYTPLQDIIVYADAANHMHGEVVSYNSATGVLIINIHKKEGSGNYCNWTLNLDAIKLAEVSVYFDDVDPITAGQTGIEGDLFYKTSNGLNTGSKLETWVYDGTTWVKVDEKTYASGSILAANACVGTLIDIPTGNTNDVKTVGTGGDFADLQTALANTSVVDNTILRLVSNLTTSTTINVTKKVIIDGNGFNLESDTANPVTMLNITAGATIKDFGKISHLKTTNTSVETVISINSPDPVYIYNNTIELQEFGIVTRGSFFIGKNTFKYVGASLTNSHRFIMLNGNSGESRIYENNYECSVMPATTRYSNFIYATSTTGTVYEGKLFINNNIQTAGNLRQFYLHDSGVPNNMELYVANNTFNDFNGGIGIFGVAVYNGYKKIGIYNNTQGADSAGNYKGLFFVDGTGAINENVVLEYGDNILGTTALRADYLSYDVNGSSEIAIKNTITFVNKKEKVTIQKSLEDLGILIQDLKGKKTYITDSNGNSLEGLGTLESPYKLPEVKLLWIELASEGRTNGVEVPTAGGYYLVYNYKGQTIYRYITTAIDSNGYPLQDEFYSTLTGTTLSNLITKRY
jgi:hypothetical protein